MDDRDLGGPGNSQCIRTNRRHSSTLAEDPNTNRVRTVVVIDIAIDIDRTTVCINGDFRIPLCVRKLLPHNERQRSRAACLDVYDQHTVRIGAEHRACVRRARVCIRDISRCGWQVKRPDVVLG